MITLVRSLRQAVVASPWQSDLGMTDHDASPSLQLVSAEVSGALSYVPQPLHATSPAVTKLQVVQVDVLVKASLLQQCTFVRGCNLHVGCMIHRSHCFEACV